MNQRDHTTAPLQPGGPSMAEASLSRRTLGRVAALTVGAGVVASAEVATSTPAYAELGLDPKVAVREWALPAALETHEFVKLPNANMLLITQNTPSRLVKVQLSTLTSGLFGLKVDNVAGFPLGTADSVAHGIWNSTAYPGRVWVTLEGDNKVLLLDPRPLFPNLAPLVVRTINLPSPANGPHYITEYGNDLWVTLKGSDQVLRISHVNTSNFTLYDLPANPILIAQHPTNNDFYVSCDDSSKIARITPSNGAVTILDIPASAGTTPVGLIAGTDGNVWFVLACQQDTGTGTFARIEANNNITYYTLTSQLAESASLLHLAFRANTLWLLSSSLTNSASPDSIIRVTFTSGNAAIATETQWMLPTPLCKNHRILPVSATEVFVTELATSRLAQLGLA